MKLLSTPRKPLVTPSFSEYLQPRETSFSPLVPCQFEVPDQYDEDLFDKTKMTFGEHLDELRQALIKSVAALVLGTLVGLIFAQRLVIFIQTPLEAALVDYYKERGEEQYLEELEQRKANGEEVPENLQTAARDYGKRELVRENRLISRLALQAALDRGPAGQSVSAEATNTDVSLPAPTDLIPITLYYRLSKEDDPRLNTIALNMQEPFLVWIKAALVLGIVVASPFVFFFIWEFVAAGLYPHERRYVHIFLPFSLGLFLFGAGLAFFVVFQFVLHFLLAFYGWMGINPAPRITEWVNFVLILPVGFGIGFQLPLVMLFLERIGIFTVKIYRENWRIAVLIISVLSMLLTPADWQSMIFMFVSLTVLYFGGILLCVFMPRRKTPLGDAIE
jgi:sec-independent protein translocase protein TatC